MFHRTVSPRRVLVVLASARKTVNPQYHTIFRNPYPQITKARTLLQVFPPRNYTSVAEAEVQEKNQVLNILRERQWCHETERKLNGISNISEDHTISALKTLNPEKALSFFTWYKKHPSYKPSSSVYNAMLKVVCKKTHIQYFWKLAKEMKSYGFLMGSYVFSKAMARFQTQGMPEDILKLFMWTIEKDKEQPSSRCHKILFALSTNKTPDIDAAYRVIEAFKKGGGSMDKMVYDGLHRCLTKAGRFNEAKKVMDTMTTEGFAPDNITYAQLIFGLCNAYRFEDAVKIIQVMKRKGCDPDPVTWTVILECHCNAKKFDTALGLFSEMLESRCSVDSQLIQVLVSRLCKKDREMDAYNVMCKIIVEQKAKPLLATYREVINKLTESRRLNKACKLFALMKEHNHYYDCHLSIAQPIFNYFGQRRSVDAAYSFLTKFKKRVGLSGKSCTAMVSAFWEAGRQREALELVSILPPNISNSNEMLSITKGAKSDKTKSEGSTESDDNSKKDGAAGKEA